MDQELTESNPKLAKRINLRLSKVHQSKGQPHLGSVLVYTREMFVYTSTE